MFTNLELSHGVYDYLYVTSDVDAALPDMPTEWDASTIMQCDFNGNISAGNVDFSLETIDGVKIKRRQKGTFDWITLDKLSISDAADLLFVAQDYFNQDGIEYEYALVPTLGEVEGNYIIQSVQSKFNGVFICDSNTIFKFFAEPSYGDTESIQKIGIYEPIGAKYPIIVSNSEIDYTTGSVSGLVLNPAYEETRIIDRHAIVEFNKLLDRFLKNKKAKIIKDYNSNIKLVVVTGNPATSYNNEYGMGLINTLFSWTEQGDPNNQRDLYKNGLVGVRE